MKKLGVAMLSAALTMASQVDAQTNSNVPEKVKASFSKKFPNVKEVKWDKENETEWEAEFKMNGKKYSANFTPDGVWKETEYEIKYAEVPEVVKQKLKTEFNGYDIEEAEIAETKDGKVYEFALEKGKTELEVAISPDGKVLKKEEKKEDAEKDDDK